MTSKKLANLLTKIDQSKTPHQVFNDFLEIAHIAIFNNRPGAEKDPNLEENFERVISRYKPECKTKFSEALALVIEALQDNPNQDLLGTLAGEIGNTNDNLGQFFTPYHLAQMMVRLNLTEQVKNPDIFKDATILTPVKVAEPSCGSGVMIIALRNYLVEHEIPLHRVWVEMTDLSFQCVQMAYIQTSLLGMRGIVRHGNTISGEVFSQYPLIANALPAYVLPA